MCWSVQPCVYHFSFYRPVKYCAPSLRFALCVAHSAMDQPQHNEHAAQDASVSCCEALETTEVWASNAPWHTSELNQTLKIVRHSQKQTRLLTGMFQTSKLEERLKKEPPSRNSSSFISIIFYFNHFLLQSFFISERAHTRTEQALEFVTATLGPNCYRLNHLEIAYSDRLNLRWSAIRFVSGHDHGQRG